MTNSSFSIFKFSTESAKKNLVAHCQSADALRGHRDGGHDHDGRKLSVVTSQKLANLIYDFSCGVHVGIPRYADVREFLAPSW